MSGWRAFWRGFFAGLAAPALMFPRVEKPPRQSDTEALAGDWRKVGDDMRSAMAVRESVAAIDGKRRDRAT